MTHKLLPHPLRSLGCALAAVGLCLAAYPQNEDENDELYELNPFLVQGQTTGYLATESFSATRIAMPIEEIPFNLTVMTDEFIDDVAGVSSTFRPIREILSWSASAGGQFGKSLRGFNTREFLRNGTQFNSDSPSFNVDRVEIVKGPNAILDGSVSPGGIINVVTKKPIVGRDFMEFTTRYGYNNRKLFGADINHGIGPKVGDNSLITYRFVTSYEDFDTEGMGGDSHRLLANPSVTIAPNQKSVLTLDYEFMDFKGSYGQSEGGAAYRTISDVPLIETYNIPEDWDWRDGHSEKGEQTTVYAAHFAQEITRDIHFNARYAHTFRRVRWNPEMEVSIRDNPPELDLGPEPKAVRRNLRREESRSWNDELRLDATWKFNVGESKHRILAGLQKKEGWNDFWRDTLMTTDEDGDETVAYQWYRIDDYSRDLDLSPPADGEYGRDVSGDEFPNPLYWKQTGGWGGEGESDSYFANHQGRFMGEKLVTLVGYYLTEEKDGDVTLDNEGLPQAGFVYKFAPKVSGFFNYAESARITGRRDSFGDLLPPIRGENPEFGVKAAGMDGKLYGTASIYFLNQVDDQKFDPEKNNADTIPGDPNSPRGDWVSIGETESKGIEIDATYMPIKGWSSIFSFAYKDSEIVADPDPNLLGRPGVSDYFEWKFTNWNKYEFLEGPMKGLQIGAGFRYTGEELRFYRGNTPYYRDPTYTVDALVSYGGEVNESVGYEMSLNVRNLFGSKENAVGVRPGTLEPFYYGDDTELYFSVTFDM